MWKDTTTRGRGQENKPSDIWSLETSEIRISVMTGHRDYPGLWVMSCYALGIDARQFGAKPEATPEQAQELALKVVRQKLNKMLQSLNF